MASTELRRTCWGGRRTGEARKEAPSQSDLFKKPPALPRPASRGPRCWPRAGREGCVADLSFGHCPARRRGPESGRREWARILQWTGLGIGPRHAHSTLRAAPRTKVSAMAEAARHGAARARRARASLDSTRRRCLALSQTGDHQTNRCEAGARPRLAADSRGSRLLQSTRLCAPRSCFEHPIPSRPLHAHGHRPVLHQRSTPAWSRQLIAAARRPERPSAASALDHAPRFPPPPRPLRRRAERSPAPQPLQRRQVAAASPADSRRRRRPSSPARSPESHQLRCT